MYLFNREKSQNMPSIRKKKCILVGKKDKKIIISEIYLYKNSALFFCEKRKEKKRKITLFSFLGKNPEGLKGKKITTNTL